MVIVEEIAAGGTLLQELIHADTNDNNILVHVFRQLFMALAHLHDPVAGCCCIIHRDIKPENIIFRCCQCARLRTLVSSHCSPVQVRSVACLPVHPSPVLGPSARSPRLGTLYQCMLGFRYGTAVTSTWGTAAASTSSACVITINMRNGQVAHML